MKKSIILVVFIIVALLVAEVLVISSAIGAEKIKESAIKSKNADKYPVSRTGKKYSFTLQELNTAKQMYKEKLIVDLQWQKKLKMANEAFFNDYANVKKNLVFVLKRGEDALTNCTAQNYTVQDLQDHCNDNEGVQACLNRLMAECTSIDNAFTGWSSLELKVGLEKLKKDIEQIEMILYKDR
jgi:hypothetical protein